MPDWGTSDLHVVVIGTASLDTLHFAGQTVHTIGGAGLYTALAAHCVGARVGLYAPRPEPMPALLQPVVERLAWFGPIISPEELPRLEIAHHGEGRATLVDASWGVEWRLTPQDLPPAIQQAAFVHVAALSTAQRQLAFVQALQMVRGDRDAPRISVGTYARLVYGETETVRQLMAYADVFFMNANEAAGLFGSVAQARTRSEALLFVTLSAEGACVIAGEQVTRIPGQITTELDPTGAGDTFCGATLASMAAGASPIVAAERAVVLAASTVSAVGPAALLGTV